VAGRNADVRATNHTSNGTKTPRPGHHCRLYSPKSFPAEEIESWQRQGKHGKDSVPLTLLYGGAQVAAPAPGTAEGGVTYSGAPLAPYVISGILRDFTPALNPDFGERPDFDDRGFVANLIDTDALPGALCLR